MQLLRAVLLATLSVVTMAASLTGRLVTNLALPDILNLPVDTKVTINNGEYVSHVDADGEFYFPNIREGSHLLQVISQIHDFPKIRLDINGKIVRASLTATGLSWSRHGRFVEVPLELEPLGSFSFFKEREQFSFMSLLSNPMLLMSAGGMAVVFLLPKLNEMIDKEALEREKQELREKGESVPDVQMPNLELPDFSKKLADYFSPNDVPAASAGAAAPSTSSSAPAASKPAAPATATAETTEKKKKKKHA
eukprot:jgi/Hompol1/712/HPOL_002412-RA